MVFKGMMVAIAVAGETPQMPGQLPPPPFEVVSVNAGNIKVTLTVVRMSAHRPAAATTTSPSAAASGPRTPASWKAPLCVRPRCRHCQNGVQVVHQQPCGATDDHRGGLQLVGPSAAAHRLAQFGPPACRPSRWWLAGGHTRRSAQTAKCRHASQWTRSTRLSHVSQRALM